MDYTPLFEALRDDVGAVAKKAGEAEARAVDAERRAAVAVDVANNAEGRACAAEEAAADARNECDEIARRLAASNAALAEQGARAFLLEGRVRILEEALKGRHESEESPLEDDEYQPRDAVEDTEPVEDTRGSTNPTRHPNPLSSQPRPSGRTFVTPRGRTSHRRGLERLDPSPSRHRSRRRAGVLMCVTRTRATSRPPRSRAWRLACLPTMRVTGTPP